MLRELTLGLKSRIFIAAGKRSIACGTGASGMPARKGGTQSDNVLPFGQGFGASCPAAGNASLAGGDEGEALRANRNP